MWAPGSRATAAEPLRLAAEEPPHSSAVVAPQAASLSTSRTREVEAINEDEDVMTMRTSK